MVAHNPGFLHYVNLAKKVVNEITVSDLDALENTHENLVFVDVREDNEVKNGSMPNAIHIGKGVIDRDIETKIPDKLTPIVFFCRSGYRSLIAAHQAKEMGYQTVYSLQGGYRAWCDANNIEAPTTPFTDK
ncbi:MAG: hypothetical protein A3F17_02875 [Gammaproteobacteria bacterium RIFCSPHIGHO2_12_FULL_41_15]|nr:MAG: hypothetical protein A3F17_02875 [Gammaproteobacteria bacterium RIFCSPHIGHO2_12_FULL_41_15]